MATTADNAANRQPYHLANSFITSSSTGTTPTIRTRCLLLTPLKPSEHVPNTIHNHITSPLVLLFYTVLCSGLTAIPRLRLSFVLEGSQPSRATYIHTDMEPSRENWFSAIGIIIIVMVCKTSRHFLLALHLFC